MPSAVKADLESVLANAEEFGRFIGFELFDVSKNHNQPIRLGNLVETPQNDLSKLFAPQLIARVTPMALVVFVKPIFCESR